VLGIQVDRTEHAPREGGCTWSRDGVNVAGSMGRAAGMAVCVLVVPIPQGLLHPFVGHDVRAELSEVPKAHHVPSLV